MRVLLHFLIFNAFLYFCLCAESSVEQVLPDSLFASPTKSAGDRLSDFSTSAAEAKEGTAFPYENNSSLPITSTSYMASQ